MAVYNCEKSAESEGSLDSQIEATINRLTNLIQADYPESTIVKQGENQIRIEVPDVDDPEEVLSIIGEPAKLEFKKEYKDLQLKEQVRNIKKDLEEQLNITNLKSNIYLVKTIKRTRKRISAPSSSA